MMLWNLKPATLIPKRKIISPRPSISRRRQLCRITSRTPKIWGWDVMTKYTTDLFSLDVAYNRTRGKDTGIPGNISPALTRYRYQYPEYSDRSQWLLCWLVGTFADRLNIYQQQLQQTTWLWCAMISTSVIKGQQALKGMTTTLVLGNAFDKRVLVAGHPTGWSSTENFRELSMVIICPDISGHLSGRKRDNEPLHTLA